MRNVGVREISRKTGFSPATVSNALNHKRGVNKETAAIILRAAHELGYDRPSRVTHVNFVLARKNGLVLDEGTFHPGVIEGVERAASLQDMSTVFTTLELSDRATAAKQAHEIIHDSSSAVVLLGTEMAEEDYELFCLEVAAMFRFSGEMQNFIDDWRTFDSDLKQAMYAMFRYLKEQEETQNE